MIGIYKITSNTKKIYIGQSVNIYERFRRYKLIQNCKTQHRLYNSLIKHGVENHKFEVIEECIIEQLNERERYWQDYYDAIGENGLNLKLTETNDKSGFCSEEVRSKLSTAKKNVFNGENNPMWGKLHTDETKRKIREKALNRRLSDETKKKISMSVKKRGYKVPEHHKQKLRDIKIGVPLSIEHKEKISRTRIDKGIQAPNKKIVFDSWTGIYYDSIKEASLITGIKKNIIQYQIHKLNKRFKK